MAINFKEIAHYRTNMSTPLEYHNWKMFDNNSFIKMCDGIYDSFIKRLAKPKTIIEDKSLHAAFNEAFCREYCKANNIEWNGYYLPIMVKDEYDKVIKEYIDNDYDTIPKCLPDCIKENILKNRQKSD